MPRTDFLSEWDDINVSRVLTKSTMQADAGRVHWPEVVALPIRNQHTRTDQNDKAGGMVVGWWGGREGGREGLGLTEILLLSEIAREEPLHSRTLTRTPHAHHRDCFQRQPIRAGVSHHFPAGVSSQSSTCPPLAPLAGSRSFRSPPPPLSSRTLCSSGTEAINISKLLNVSKLCLNFVLCTVF